MLGFSLYKIPVWSPQEGPGGGPGAGAENSAPNIPKMEYSKAITPSFVNWLCGECGWESKILEWFGVGRDLGWRNLGISVPKLSFLWFDKFWGFLFSVV